MRILLKCNGGDIIGMATAFDSVSITQAKAPSLALDVEQGEGELL